ncbi:MAG: sigma-54-dependent Fis family transcriptional regulator [Proteobacteria bacterium]|nr:sigma-54-dependent Fis family transcriptional regulator [Pseudomonadota bacterium]
MSTAASILVVEDERSMREFLQILLRRQSYEVTAVDGGAEACELLAQREFALVITDLSMPQVGGLEVLRRAKHEHPATEVVMITAFASAETAIEAMKAGAYDYLTKPFKVDEVLVTLERALEKRRLVRDNQVLRQQLSDRFHLDQLIGRSAPMQRVFELVRRVAPSRASVLISGESGTGKELLARAIHALSERHERSFVAVNCGAIPEALLESELFGHVRGAFTGAFGNKEGLFTAADGGTLFLDEIAELTTALQVKLLRALQERTIKPVGSNSERAVDVRILAASNRNLERAIRDGSFRSDLYYRLNVIAVELPPLRQRRTDIPLLAEHFVRKHAAEAGRPIRGLDAAALARLCDYDFPGNVRELENLIERAVTLTAGDEIGVAVLPELRPAAFAGDGPDVGDATLPADGLDLDAHIGTIERALLQQALDRTAGTRTEAAQLLRLSLRSLRYRLAKYSLAGEADTPKP